MGTITSYHCDICKIALKKGDKKFLFAYQSLEQENHSRASEQYLAFLKGLGKEGSNYDIHYGIQHFEICVKCYNVIATALANRLEQVKKDYEDLNNSFDGELKKEIEEEVNGNE